MRIPLAITTVILIALLACGGDPNGPFTIEEVAGVYRATTLELEDSTGVVDAIADGGSIDLTLNVDGTTSGRLFVVGGNSDGSDFEADLGGMWALEGPLVQLDHDADSFLRDIGLLYNEGTLQGQREFLFSTISVILVR